MISATAFSNATTSNAAAGAVAQAAQPGGALGKDQFLKLLIAQLQHQDPLNPMQGDQMATQLAQFSSLEQLQQINASLTAQQSASGALVDAIQATAVINTIGHTVVAAGNELQLGGANGATSVTALVGDAGGKGTLHIFDQNGHEVGTRELGVINGGRQTFDIGTAGDGLAAGTYTYSIDAKDGAGNAVTVQTYMTGKVDGVSRGPSGLVLNVGAFTIPYASVVQIFN
jgi:flagellar basal-body rod modification protein FlgD